MQGRIRGISLLDGSKMRNNQFVDDSILLMRLDQDLVQATRGWLFGSFLRCFRGSGQ